MASVGSIDPDGMLKGATMRLRSTQATSDQQQDRSGAVRPPLSRSRASAVGAGRTRSARRTLPPLFRRAAIGQGGVAFGWPRHYVAHAQWPTPHQPQTRPYGSTQLFAAEPDRLSRLSFEVAGIYFDWSKTHLDQRLIDRVRGARRADGLRRRSRRPVSRRHRQSERGPAATHVAERGSGAPEDVDLAAARHQRMRALVDAIEAGAFGDVTGVLHIGIGGSALGPALLVDALGRAFGRAQVRFLSNIDGAGVRRCGEAARSGDDADRRRVEDLHDVGNPGQPRSGAATGCGTPGSRIPTAG